ncbi:MAG: hypothetical protein ACPGJV_06655 [Bacteriovoracaceae bacterium]
MRIPIYQEISFENYEASELIKALGELELGKLPYYSILHHLDYEKTKEAIDNFNQAFITLGIHPLFPYPFYLITEKVKSHDQISIFESIDALPQHFFRKVKRLKTKEQAVLQRVNLKAAKIKNIEIYAKSEELKDRLHPQRELYNVCEELQFYDYLLKTIKD